jgi:hypothetical protein
MTSSRSRRVGVNHMPAITAVEPAAMTAARVSPNGPLPVSTTSR